MGQMRKVNYGRLLVRYEDDGVKEWLRLPGDAFNNNARGFWRVDLDFEASGGIEGGGGEGGDGDESEDESGKEESGDESEDGDSSEEDEDEDGDDGGYDGSDI